MARYWDQIRVSTSKTPDARCPQDATALAKVMPPLSNSRHDILESTSLAQHHQPYRPTNKAYKSHAMPNLRHTLLRVPVGVFVWLLNLKFRISPPPTEFGALLDSGVYYCRWRASCTSIWHWRSRVFGDVAS